MLQSLISRCFSAVKMSALPPKADIHPAVRERSS